MPRQTQLFQIVLRGKLNFPLLTVWVMGQSLEARLINFSD